MNISIRVFVLLGAALIAAPSGALQQNAENLRRAAEAEPRNPTPHKQLAAYYSRQGAYHDALREYQAALTLSPADMDARLHTAELFAWTGDFDRSIASYKDLLATSPANLLAKLGLAQVLRWSHRYADAEQQLREVLDADPENRDAIKGMAQTYALAGDFGKALAFLGRGISLFPQDAEFYAQKGVVLSWNGNAKEGIEMLHKATAIDPSAASTYRSLGDAYTWRREFARAAESYRKALDLEPNSAETALDLARSYNKDGNASQAEEAVKQVLRSTPENHQALELLQAIRRDHAGFDFSGMLEEMGEPVVYLSTLLMLLWLFYRRRRLFIRNPLLYKSIYRIVLPALIVLFLMAYGARIVLQTGLYYEIAEIVLLTTIAIFAFLLSWDRRPVANPLTNRVLVVGAHPDDIELGAAGSLMRLKQEGTEIFGLVLSRGEKGNKATAGSRQGEARMAAAQLGLDELWVLNFPDTQMRQFVPEIRELIENKIQELGIHMVVTHSPQETHGDHAAVFEAAKEASRKCSLICFESISAPKEFVPNYFVDITPYLPDKLRVIGTHRTQSEKLYMDPEMVKGRAAHRGLQAGVPYAEAFWVYRWVR